MAKKEGSKTREDILQQAISDIKWQYPVGMTSTDETLPSRSRIWTRLDLPLDIGNSLLKYVLSRL